jgi:hypothetical protein
MGITLSPLRGARRRYSQIIRILARHGLILSLPKMSPCAVNRRDLDQREVGDGRDGQVHEHQNHHRAGGVARGSEQQEIRYEENRRDQRRQPGKQPLRPGAEPGHQRPGGGGSGHSHDGKQGVGAEGELAERRGNGECRLADGDQGEVGSQRAGGSGHAGGSHSP